MCKYKEKVKPYFQQIKYWRGQGLKIDQVAAKLGVSKVSLHAYQKQHPEFAAVLHESKEALVANIAINGLYKRALGYSYNEKKIVKEAVYDLEGNVVGEKVKTEMTEKQIAPDPTSCIFALKNLAPEDWKDRHEIKNTMPQESFDDLIKAFEKIAEAPEKVGGNET